jgi:hypothetical protein
LFQVSSNVLHVSLHSQFTFYFFYISCQIYFGIYTYTCMVCIYIFLIYINMMPCKHIIMHYPLSLEIMVCKKMKALDLKLFSDGCGFLKQNKTTMYARWQRSLHKTSHWWNLQQC